MNRSQDQRGSKMRALLAAALIIACTFAISIAAAIIDQDAQSQRAAISAIIESKDAIVYENAEVQQRFARLQAEYDELIRKTNLD